MVFGQDRVGVGVRAQDPIDEISAAASAYSNSRMRLDHEKGHFFTGARDAREFYSDWITSFLERVQSRYAPAKHLIIT